MNDALLRAIFYASWHPPGPMACSDPSQAFVLGGAAAVSGVAVALVVASGGWVPWVAVLLALFAAGPVAALGMVLPQYLKIARAADAGRSDG